MEVNLSFSSEILGNNELYKKRRFAPNDRCLFLHSSYSNVVRVHFRKVIIREMIRSMNKFFQENVSSICIRRIWYDSAIIKEFL
jgi:hypothetical protein